MLTGLRPVVLGGLQRGLLATGFWQAPLTIRVPAAPIVLTGGAAYPHNLPLTKLDGKPLNLSDQKG